MRRSMTALVAGLAILSAAAGQPVAAPGPVAQQDMPGSPMRPLMVPGYIPVEKANDGLALVTAPPAPGSAALERDRMLEREALERRGSARWTLAMHDADLRSAGATGAFSCAAGRVIGPEATPITDALLRKTLPDLARISAAPKQHFGRKRPFEGNGQPICTPQDEAGLRGNASYPSGHATIGYGWAMILADLLPARRKALLQRGIAFGDSRRICNVHFASDVEAGARLADPVFRALKTEPRFIADMAAARAELRSLQPVQPDCSAESAAIAERKSR